MINDLRPAMSTRIRALCKNDSAAKIGIFVRKSGLLIVKKT